MAKAFYAGDLLERTGAFAMCKGDGLAELQHLVVGTLNGLIERVCKRQRLDPMEIIKVTVAGNTTMINLFAGLPPASIRLARELAAMEQVDEPKALEKILDILRAAAAIYNKEKPAA